MIFDATKPVQTRDGKGARVLCTDAKAPYPLVALIAHGNGEVARHYSSDGATMRNSKSVKPLPDDLINIPKRRWAVLFMDGTYEQCKDEDEARSYIGNSAIACIEFTEGQGLEDKS